MKKRAWNGSVKSIQTCVYFALLSRIVVHSSKFFHAKQWIAFKMDVGKRSWNQRFWNFVVSWFPNLKFAYFRNKNGCQRENAGTLGWYPSCLSPPRSPLKGDIPNKYPLYKVYMRLITKGTIPRVPPFSLWGWQNKAHQLHKITKARWIEAWSWRQKVRCPARSMQRRWLEKRTMDHEWRRIFIAKMGGFST